jgi:hypothetical protein
VNIKFSEIEGFYLEPKDNFVIIGADFKEVSEKLRRARPKHIVRAAGDAPYEGVHAISLRDYKKKRKNEAILLAVNPDGNDFRPCVRAIVDIYDALTDGEDETLEIYVDYRLLYFPTDRLREFTEKRFFLKAFRMFDENRILAENPDAKADIVKEEFGVSEEIAREAEVFMCDTMPFAGGGKIFEDIQNDGKNTLYVFGASQLIDLMNTPAFKEKFLSLAKEKGFNVSLNISVGKKVFTYLSEILSLPLIPGDRVFFTLSSYHLSYEPNRENIPAVLIWLSKHLESQGVKTFIYLAPVLTSKTLTPYEKILPRAYGLSIQGADDETHKAFNSKWEEFIAEQRNNFAANGVRLFYNLSLNKSEKLCFSNICHYTRSGNAILSEEILGLIENSDFLNEDYAKKLRPKAVIAETLFQYKAISGIFKGIDVFAQSLLPHKKDGNSGAIVMNCNPVTNGHMHLIETAAKQVDNLFIFVVEEDRSEFPFAERLELVKENCKGIENVTVLPSGRFIISQLTFPEYFMKADKTELDPSGKPSIINDVTAFAVKIAPALGIKVRFAGEEPLDPVTREYNRVMGNLLPFYGVEFNEIKRKETDGEVISASRVRKLLHEGNFEAIKPLVPEATFRYLTERQKNK